MKTATVPTDSAPYRIRRPTTRLVLSDMRIAADDPGPGDQVPLLDLELLDGDRLTTEVLHADCRPLLLVFGSVTCPVTESAVPGLRALATRYRDRIRTVLVNVREAHPGALVGQPETMGAKRVNAQLLRVHHDLDLDLEIAVDDLDGTHHRAFGTRPSSAYLIDSDGTILFRAQWSNLPCDIDAAIAATRAGKPISVVSATGTLRAMAAMTGYADTTFRTAGPGASVDTWRAAPPFGAMITASGLFAFLPQRQRGLPGRWPLWRSLSSPPRRRSSDSSPDRRSARAR